MKALCVLACVVLLLLAACGVVPEKVKADDPRLKPLFDAMAAVDRASMGFTPIPTDAELRLESRPRGGYDAMLHVDGVTSRTIAFRRTGDGYEWIGEQEIHRGPKTHTTVDGTFPETITITVERVPISGGTRITYSGEDPRLAGRGGLTLADVRPVLAEWDARR